jgi:hypothetical protein
MEEKKYEYELNINEDWHKEWTTICESRTDFSSKFSKEQKEHFEKYLKLIDENIKHPDIDTTYVKYSGVHKYISELYEASYERSLPSHLESHLDFYKWKELHQIFFHYYYNEFLEESEREIINEFLNPDSYSKRYELIFLSQFLPKPYPVVENPSISIYDIDKAIILQMDKKYEGGEKIAFLNYQYEKFDDINTRSISLLGYLEDLRKQKVISKASYIVAEKYINQKIQTNTKFDAPIRTKLNLKQIGIFYRLLAGSDFTDDTNKRIFNILTLTHQSKDGKYPTMDYLEKQTSKASNEDIVRLSHIIDELKKNLKNFIS